MEKDDSEFVEIPGGPGYFEEMMRQVFFQAGFAKYYDESVSKLLPCPPGTFVDISDIRKRCKYCPAGKLAQILCIKSY